MCDTFIVRHVVAGGRAVAKVLRSELSYRQGIAARVEREARILAAIDHPNVIRLFDAGRWEDRPYLVVEHAGALDLDQRMKDLGGAIGVLEAVRIFRAILSALDTIHAAGVVHRDVKPANIFLTDPPSGQIKLIDFGVSLVESEPALTRTGAIFGTPAFMSPEQAGGMVIDLRTDLFATASTIYAALTGRPPFFAESPVQVIMKVVHDRAEPPQGLKEPIPPGLSDLLLRMLAKEPSDRPASAAEAMATLDGIDIGLPEDDYGDQTRPVPALKAPKLGKAKPRGKAKKQRNASSTSSLQRRRSVQAKRPPPAPPPSQPEPPAPSRTPGSEVSQAEMPAAQSSTGGAGYGGPPSIGGVAAPASAPKPEKPSIKDRVLGWFAKKEAEEEPDFDGAPTALPEGGDIIDRDTVMIHAREQLQQEQLANLAETDEEQPDDPFEERTETEVDKVGMVRVGGAAAEVFDLAEDLEEVESGSSTPADFPDSFDDFDDTTIANDAPAVIERQGAIVDPSNEELDRALDALDDATLASAPPIPGSAPTPPADWTPPESIEVQLDRVGFGNLDVRGQTPDGLMSYDAVHEGASVVVHVGRRDPPHYDARARVDALRWLIEERPPLFAPFVKEVPLVPDHSAFVRLGRAPPRIQERQTFEPQPALAIATVCFRALSWLYSVGRRFDDFSHNRVRTEATSPSSFRCLLDVPVEFVAESEAIYTTAAGGVIKGDPGYFSPGMVNGRHAQHDAGYRTGALLYNLLTGYPPFGHDQQALIGVFFRRVAEDPPSVRRYQPDVDPKIADLVDRLVARDASYRASPPADIEEEMLSLLDEGWHSAVSALLEAAPRAAHVPETERSVFEPRGPTLSSGDRVTLWIVDQHLDFGGEAELYRVVNQSRARGILKLWYDNRVDPYGPAWREFKVGLTGCAAHHAFPALLDADVLVRGVARPYVVLEEVEAPTWRDKVLQGPMTNTGELLDIGRALVEAVGVVHDHFGVVGDLSGHNVLLHDARGPILLDVASPNIRRSAIGGFGTAGYAAPEVASGAPPSASSDLFSAGVLLSELALGRTMFPERVEETLIPVGGFEARIDAAIEELRETCGVELAFAFGRMMAPDPRDRPRDAEETAQVLEEARARYEVRRAAERRTSSATLTGLERKMPKPIAHALRAYRIAREPTEKAHLGLGLAETVARFVATLALADYLSAPHRNEKVEEELKGLTRRVSFGMWVAIAREAGRAIRERTEEAFIPELSVLFLGTESEGRAALEKLVELRNGLAHRGLKAEVIVPEIDRELRVVLSSLVFLTGRPMLRAIGQRTRRDGSQELEVEDLHGTAVEPERRSLVVLRPPPSEVVFMAAQDFSARLLLDPFFVVRRCDCGAPHVFMFAGAKRDGRIQYLDHASGHRLLHHPEAPDGQPVSFFELIAQRETLHLAGGLGAELSEAERWWAGDAPVGHGDALGRYILEEEIGRGSMGIVFRARHPELGSTRAVKVLKLELVESDRSLMRRLHQEARIMEKLSTHPGIARVFDYGTTPDESTCYLVMELLEGGSLSDRLQRSPRPPLAEVIATWEALADALAFVHEHGVVHRDLKPSNVLFDRDGRLKIGDFGVARKIDASKTATYGFQGAPLYAAPEQLARAGIDQRTDAYALGLLAFDLIRGRLPVLDAQRRALELRRTITELERGEVSEAMQHHEDLPLLRKLLIRAADLTAAEPSGRSSELGPQ